MTGVFGFDTRIGCGKRNIPAAVRVQHTLRHQPYTLNLIRLLNVTSTLQREESARVLESQARQRHEIQRNQLADGLLRRRGGPPKKGFLGFQGDRGEDGLASYSGSVSKALLRLRCERRLVSSGQPASLVSPCNARPTSSPSVMLC